MKESTDELDEYYSMLKNGGLSRSDFQSVREGIQQALDDLAVLRAEIGGGDGGRDFESGLAFQLNAACEVNKYLEAELAGARAERDRMKANYDELVVLLDPDGSAGDDHEAIKREALVMFGKLGAIQEERDRMKAALERIQDQDQWDAVWINAEALYAELLVIAREGLEGKR